jgi:hypothetical protein
MKWLSYREEETIKEVASQFDGLDVNKVLTAVAEELHTGPHLKAYNVACRICAEQERAKHG